MATLETEITIKVKVDYDIEPCQKWSWTDPGYPAELYINSIAMEDTAINKKGEDIKVDVLFPPAISAIIESNDEIYEQIETEAFEDAENDALDKQIEELERRRDL